MKTHRFTMAVLFSLAWACCGARPINSVPTQNHTIRQGIAYITYPVVVGPKAGMLNPVIQQWIGSNCDSWGHGGVLSDTYRGVKDCLAALAKYCAGPAGGDNASESTCEDNITAAVDMNSDGFLVVELDHFSHANMEPHGNSVIEYLNLDVSSSRILNLSDLLISHYEPALDVMLVRALRKQWDVPAGKTPIQFGMLTNDPGVPQEFEIRPSGLLFTYQVGDVGPDAFGNMAVLIPYSELSSLIQKNGPLQRLLISAESR